MVVYTDGVGVTASPSPKQRLGHDLDARELAEMDPETLTELAAALTAACETPPDYPLWTWAMGAEPRRPRGQPHERERMRRHVSAVC